MTTPRRFKHCPHCGQPVPLISEHERRKLNAVRRNYGLSLNALALEIGISDSTLCYWEQGERTPSQAHYAAWRTALGLE